MATSTVVHRREFKGADLHHYYAMFPPRNSLCREEEADLVRQAQAGNTWAEGRLVKQWGRRVIQLALRRLERRPEGLDLDDLIGWGFLGLLLGIRAFDLSRGTRLSTCVNYWITEYIQKGSRSQRFIHLPSDHLQTWHSALSVADKNGINMVSPTEETWQTLSEILMKKAAPSRPAPTPKYVQKSFELAQMSQTFHLDAYDSANEPSWNHAPPFETFAAPEAPTQTEAQEQLSLAIQQLDERERLIISHRFALNDFDFLTLDELGSRCKLSKERIRQIESEAIEKLRAELTRKLSL